VHGNWRVQSGADAWDLALEQKYQMLEGSVKFGAINAGLRDTRLQGEKISFAFVDGAGVKREFNGRVTGNAMEGTVKADNGPEARWTAAKR
jgi:hypothetical protein